MAIVPIRNLGGGSGSTPLASGVLYDNGNGRSKWDSTEYGYNTSNPFKGTILFETSDIKLTPTQSNRSVVSVLTQNKVDFSGYSALKVTYKTNSDSQATLSLNISSLNSSYYVAIHADYQGSVGYVRVFALPTTKSNYQGTESAFAESGNVGTINALYIYKVWLE